MELKTLGAWAGFALQVCAGAAAAAWPSEKTLWIGISIAGFALLLASGTWWFFANYRFRWPIRHKGQSTDVGPQWRAPPAETVSSRTYVNEQVEVDGKKFDRCHFNNVTMKFRGTAPFAFFECQFTGQVFFITDHPAVKAALSYGNMLRERTKNAPPGVTASFGFGVKDERGKVTVTVYDRSGGDAPAPEPCPPEEEK